ALKIIQLNSDQVLMQEDDFRRRFAQEAEVIARLEHLHILPVYDYGIEGEVAYLAMRWLRGGTVAKLLDAEHLLSFERTAYLINQIASGLAYAHGKGVIHRDLKPSNILLDEAGNAYLSDFGLAKLTESSAEITKSGNIVGTPTYMSPEQLRGDKIDHRADIYSLGVILYHMIAGRPVFESDESNVIAIMYQHLEKQPTPPNEVNPDVPLEVSNVVLKALEKNPAARYDSAEALADALNGALGLRSTASFPAVSTAEHSTATRKRPMGIKTSPDSFTASQRRRLIFAAIAVIVVVLVVLALVVEPLLAPPNRITPTPAVLAGEEGTADLFVPSGAEIANARERLGANGFIAYVTCNQSSQYHSTQAREVGDFAANYGLAYRIYDSNNDSIIQISQIERARADGAKALLICPLDAALLANTLEAAQAAHLPLVFFSSDMPSYGGVLVVGNDYEWGIQAGHLAAQIITDEMDGVANVIILDYASLPHIVERADGLEDGILELAPNANIIGRYPGAIREDAARSVRELLENGVEFNVIASINDAGSYGAIDALEEANIASDSVIITSVDAEPPARQFIEDGYYMRGSVEVGREQFSHAALDAMVRLLGGGTVPEIVLVPAGDVFTGAADQ
ncbi:MAG: substrate-binding domain-containing protein, partial [Burkholderiales bacterium]|nr:substrate-binding domain-containing protein [Anaerolineae bacterium]